MFVVSVLEKVGRNYIVIRNSKAYYRTEKVKVKKEKTKKEMFGWNIDIEMADGREIWSPDSAFDLQETSFRMSREEFIELLWAIKTLYL